MCLYMKPMHLEPALRNKRSHRKDKPRHCNKEQPLLAATTESPCRAVKTQHCPRKKNDPINLHKANIADGMWDVD